MLINNELSWQYWIAQRMAFKTFDTFVWPFYTWVKEEGDTLFPGDIFYNTHYGGNWYPSINNHYVGVYFSDSEDKMHYGWIRCAVKHEGRILVIKDFAYEQQPDVPIIAGSLESYVPVPENENSFIASIYSFHNTIHVQVNESFGYEITISVFDITGREVKKETTAAGKTELVLHAPEGIYIVEVTSEKNKFVEKVYLQK